MPGPGDNRTPEQKLNSAERNARWLELKLKGYTYRQIAKIEGKSASYICEEVQREIKKIPTENAEDLKAQMLEQIDEDYRRLEPIANHTCDGFCEEEGCKLDYRAVTAAVQTRIRLMESKRKLLGLDAPIETKSSIEIVGLPDHLQGIDLSEDL